MISRPLRWLHRLAALFALAGILVGPQAMVAAACQEPAEGGHRHHSHQQHSVPQHCCDLCSVVCSGTALQVVSGSPDIANGLLSIRLSDVRFESGVVVSVRFLYPLALGPPSLLV